MLDYSIKNRKCQYLKQKTLKSQNYEHRGFYMKRENLREKINSCIGIKLMMLRETKGVTQAVVANETGISRTSIVAYESGKSIPDLEKLYLLAEYYDVSCDFLLGKASCTTHDLSYISEKTGLTEKSINALEKYYMAKDDNQYDITELINQLLESKYCKQFFVSLIKYISTKNMDSSVFSNEVYYNLYMCYYDIYYNGDSEEQDSVAREDVLYSQVIHSLKRLINSIESDKKAKSAYISFFENKVKSIVGDNILK